jgi:hypothetical protein
MNTPPPTLTIDGTTEPPSGQHGPSSGIRDHRPGPAHDVPAHAPDEQQETQQ